ncbi:hypothetical protein [Campylobacter geochelonis]|uniref:EF-hand domain-containing protein n=1 Tax=Campylobacter geochelonis TaxID=1780362 RepID=A0A128EL74_9BACT|nr:hypothetical protein [Campylobacter geochelonis]QKF72154.1 hypothetical protein CGEO_1888 [Campylobacter geochelonis]CZE46007.1 Uncharacterised protein [Campylobacter geochelonis]CZE46619.1 Uncharacterised protein [Campylobacter geochelonis]CZE49762.1 Uncharacterised protein [Campylobacter geochelonis]
MDINALTNMISSLKGDGNLLSKFKENPVAVVEQFLGVDLPDDQVNAVISGLKSNFLGEKAQGAVDSQGHDFSAIIASLASSKFDANGDGKLGLDDLGGILGGFMGDKGQNQADKSQSPLGNLKNIFKI